MSNTLPTPLNPPTDETNPIPLPDVAIQPHPTGHDEPVFLDNAPEPEPEQPVPPISKGDDPEKKQP
jgi:hypothetical protein